MATTSGFLRLHVTLRLLAALILQMLALPTQSHAQSWPAQPLHVIVSQAAGSTPDIICRLVMNCLSRGIGQQIVVENRPGGNVIGAQAAAHSAPDGYTLFFATAAALVTNPYTFRSLPYDPLKDFVPISMVANGVFLVLSHPGSSCDDAPGVVRTRQGRSRKVVVRHRWPEEFFRYDRGLTE